MLRADRMADGHCSAYKYLQCVHGEHHHSFVFANGKFLGDGFELQQQRMAPALSALLAEASARLTCQREGDKD